MRIQLRYAAPLLVAATLGGVAPIAVAAADPGTGSSCTSTGLATTCASPGNSQVTATPPHVQFRAQYPFYLVGK